MWTFGLVEAEEQDSSGWSLGMARGHPQASGALRWPRKERQ